MLLPENWDSQQTILVILAHPDDPEFFCGATTARWVEMGHRVNYCLLTHGTRGSNDPDITPSRLAKIREKEQRLAADELGVTALTFLNFEDGYLVAGLEERRAVTRVLRQEKPDVVVTCDPTNLFPRENAINHPDHRAAGQIVIDAVFPAAGNPMFFRELMDVEGLKPHSIKELWIANPVQPNTVLDITRTWPKKLAALHQHVSQIGEVEKFDERMRSRRAPDSTEDLPRYEEKFRRLIFQ